MPDPDIPERDIPCPEGLRVLVVDDHEDTAEMLNLAVSSKGHQVRVAYDAAVALRICAEFQPDVALLDISMPVMDGYQLATQLRQLPGMEEVRIVAVTGSGEPIDRGRSRIGGFDRHLVKPIDLDALERILCSIESEISTRRR
jgi:CheY-like chemotaxis protein